MRNGCIPPAENHPLYQDWLQASIRHLKTKQRLEGMSHGDPHYAAAYLEGLAAQKAYEAIVEKVTHPAQTRPALLP
jgi:hypothetical protein